MQRRWLPPSIPISIHALCEEGDRCRRCPAACLQDFYPRPPRGGRPALYDMMDALDSISIHALREEGDFGGVAYCRDCQNFYPRPPRGGRPHNGGKTRQIADFYPRPPRGGRRLFSRYAFTFSSFLSTPSARRATIAQSMGTTLLDVFLSTPSARRATHQSGLHRTEGSISIHALREEGDKPSASNDVHMDISIHALREEGDLRQWPPCGWSRYFYPRPPRGGRLRAAGQHRQHHIFLSTPSARRATTTQGGTQNAQTISIHALCEEGDAPHQKSTGA